MKAAKVNRFAECRDVRLDSVEILVIAVGLRLQPNTQRLKRNLGFRARIVAPDRSFDLGHPVFDPCWRARKQATPVRHQIFQLPEATLKVRHIAAPPPTLGAPPHNSASCSRRYVLISSLFRPSGILQRLTTTMPRCRERAQTRIHGGSLRRCPYRAPRSRRRSPRE